MKDATNPTYYRTDDGIETIDVIKAFTKDLYGIEAFCTGNAIKYFCRWKKKGGVEDLKKAKWYTDTLIKYETACNDPGCIEYDEYKAHEPLPLKNLVTDEEPPEFETMYYYTYIAARAILENLKNEIKTKGYASVEYYYALSEYEDFDERLRDYIWNDLSNAIIRQYDDAWFIDGLQHPLKVKENKHKEAVE